jgi:hypothetical protein
MAGVDPRGGRDGKVVPGSSELRQPELRVLGPTSEEGEVLVVAPARGFHYVRMTSQASTDLRPRRTCLRPGLNVWRLTWQQVSSSVTWERRKEKRVFGNESVRLFIASPLGGSNRGG